MLYYLVLGLQIYCAYHVYTTRNKIYWYLVIFFLPVLGSIIYLITQVFTKKDVDKVQNEITAVINPTKKTKDLEAKVQFSDTFQNRLDLADAYNEIHIYDKAISNYKEALKGMHTDDFYGNSQLIKAYYHLEEYQEVITYAQRIKDKPSFEKSKAQFMYGLALSKTGAVTNAEEILKKIDQRYSNYEERFILASFFIEHDKKEQAKALLEEMINEGENLTKPNQKKYRATFTEIKKLYQDINS